MNNPPSYAETEKCATNNSSSKIIRVNDMRGYLFFDGNHVMMSNTFYPVTLTSICYTNGHTSILPCGEYIIHYRHIDIAKFKGINCNPTYGFEKHEMLEYKDKRVIFDIQLIKEDDGVYKAVPGTPIIVKGIVGDNGDIYFNNSNCFNLVAK